MRVKGEITITFIKPTTSNLVGVYFSLNNKKYSWQTSVWKSGSNPIPYAKQGDKFNVSFSVCDDGWSVKNLRILK